MKKIRVIILFILLFLISGCDSKEYLTSISYKEFLNKVNNKDTFFVEIVQDGCSHCAEFTPKFNEILKEYDVYGYQINITKLSEEDSEKFLDDYDIDGTPTIMFLNNGIENSKMDRIEGSKSKNIVVSKLRSHGYIK